MRSPLVALVCNLLLLLLSGTRFVSVWSLSSTSKASTGERLELQTRNSPRPLLQHWWPVTLTSSLDPSKPNAVDLLGQKFVLFHDGDEWNCLKDQCAHRFAPLSDGRILHAESAGSSHDKNGKKSACVQCAYHGWEFNGKGSCTKIPQLSSSEQQQQQQTGTGTTNAPSVPSYPVKEAANMVWIWADAASHELAETVPMPISPLLDQFLKDYPDSGFMRDLPYGLELLGENLVDISHLPFSHHSVAGFDRDDAQPLTLKLWSKAERLEGAQQEFKEVFSDDQKECNGQINHPLVLPRFQAQILNAAETDPSMLARAKFKPAAPSNKTLATTAFYEPSHIRYRRVFGDRSDSSKTNAANIEMFLCPLGPGRSRVMLFNSFERFLQRNLDAAVKQKKSFLGRWKQRFIHSRIQNSFLGTSAEGHHSLNDIFDGDAVFLHQQGYEMARDGLTPGDYNTPSTADVAVRSFRRWLDAAAQSTPSPPPTTTQANGAILAVQSVSGPSLGSNNFNSNDRSTILDRYNQHTKHCQVCLTAMNRLQKRQKILERMATFLLGISGSAVTLAFASAVAAKRAVLPSTLVLGITSMCASFLANRRVKALQQQFQKFIFLDYDHSVDRE